MRHIFLLWMTCSSGIVFAQQITQYSQYYINPFSINPALSGYSEQSQAYFLRNQKNLGFDLGNVSNLLTVDGSIFDGKIGIGGTVMSDQMGPLSTQGGYLALSYTVKISEETKLGFGFSGGVADKRYDLSDVVIQDLNDPMLQMGFPARRTYMDASLGLYLDIKKLQIGIAMPQLFANGIPYYSSRTNLDRHYTAHFAYDWELNETLELSLKPFVRMMYVPGAPFQYDVNARLDMKRIGWINVGWRSNYALSANIGFHIKNNLHLGYAYNFVMNNTKAYGPSQQEVLLGITFGKGSGRKDNKALEEAKKENDRLMLENSKLQNEKDSLMILKTKAEVELRNEKENSKNLSDSLAEVEKRKSEREEENKKLREENESLRKQLESGGNSSNNSNSSNNGNTNNNGNNFNSDEESKRLKKENEDLKKQVEKLKSDVVTSNNNSNNNNNGNNTNNSNNNGNTTNNNNSNNSQFSGDIRKSVNDQFYEIDKTTDASKGFYVVVGAFGNITNAESALAKQQANFPDAKLIYNTRNNLHYVILGYSAEKTEVYPVHSKAKNSGIQKIWILDY